MPGSATRGHSPVPNARRNCSITPPSVTGSGCIRSQVTRVGASSPDRAAASQAMVAAMSSTATGWNGTADSACRKIERKRRQRAHHGAAAIGRWRDDEARAAGSRKATPDAAISRSASRLVVLKAVRSVGRSPGNRYLNQSDRAAAIARSPAAAARRNRGARRPMSLPGRPAAAPTQLTTTSIPWSPISRASVDASSDRQRHLQIERAWLLRRREFAARCRSPENRAPAGRR